MGVVMTQISFLVIPLLFLLGITLVNSIFFEKKFEKDKLWKFYADWWRRLFWVRKVINKLKRIFWKW